MKLLKKLFVKESPLSSGAFANALLTAHNHLLVELLGRKDAAPQEVVNAIDLLDSVIEIAIENDWLADVESED